MFEQQIAETDIAVGVEDWFHGLHDVTRAMPVHVKIGAGCYRTHDARLIELHKNVFIRNAEMSMPH